MTLYTSLSPNPAAAEIQRACVQSWLDHGHDVVCVQGHDDDVSASLPSGSNGADVLYVKPTIAGKRRRPYVSLDSILDVFLASGEPHCALINGDIAIDDPAGLIEASVATGSLICGRRWDHNGDRANPVEFTSGYDLFVLHREHALAVPRSLFVLGQTWWDYWLPWSCSVAGHRLNTFPEPVIYHKRHPLNYDNTDWLRMTQHFCWLTHRANMSQPQRVSGEIHAAINKAIATT